MPTIDERLEAITHTLELVAQMQHQGEQRVGRIETIVNVLAEDQVKGEARMDRLERNLDRLERVVSRVFVAVEDHEERLKDLEDA